MRYRVVLGQNVAKTMEKVGMPAMQVLLQNAGNCSPGTSIKWFIEDQAFLDRMIRLLAHPLSPPLPWASCFFFSVHCSLRDETSANTPRFPYPYGAMIFITVIPIGFWIANQKTRRRLNFNFKGLSQNGGRAKLAKNLRAAPFTKEMSKGTTFSLIHV